MSDALVSVVMAVYKEKPEYIRMSIESILSQTYQNIELILVNDDPGGLNGKLLDEYARQSDKIKIIHNEQNVGLPASLNKAIAKSKGDYIARMDGDDIALCNRLNEQIKYLQANDFDLIGSYIERIDENGVVTGISRLPSDTTQLKKLLPYATVAFHPTWFGKSALFKDLLYNERFITSQDYEFLNRAVKKGYKVSNVEQVLMRYREVSESLSLSKSFLQIRLHHLVRESIAGKIKDIDKAALETLNHTNMIEEERYTSAFDDFLQFIRTRELKYIWGYLRGY